MKCIATILSLMASLTILSGCATASHESYLPPDGKSKSTQKKSTWFADIVTGSLVETAKQTPGSAK